MKKLPTPKWETVVSEATRKGFSPESIVAYGYFGSLAVGTATEESDEDIFVIVDKPVSAKKKMNRGESLDSKFFSCFDWVEDREGANCEVFFDVLAIGNVIYPKMVRREGNAPEYNPWAAYIRNFRLNPYKSMLAARGASRNAAKRRDEMSQRESYDPVSMKKRARSARKEEIKARKLEEYVFQMLTNPSPVYRPAFNEAERAYVLTD